MSITVRLFPCLSDNYGFLVRDDATGKVAAIDSPDAEAILADLAASGWGRLDYVLNTHWHPDHTQGNARLKATTGCEIIGPDEVMRAAPLDRVVGDGDIVELGETRLRVILSAGHTLGHIIYHAADDAVAFVGDVLFPLGCGRLFEGSPEQMFESLGRLKAFDDATVLYSAHEYAASNAKFALSISDDEGLKAHCAEIFAMRERAEATVPTTVGIEKRFNPFLTAADVQEFAARRAAKDSFSG